MATVLAGSAHTHTIANLEATTGAALEAALALILLRLAGIYPPGDVKDDIPTFHVNVAPRLELATNDADIVVGNQVDIVARRKARTSSALTDLGDGLPLATATGLTIEGRTRQVLTYRVDSPEPPRYLTDRVFTLTDAFYRINGVAKVIVDAGRGSSAALAVTGRGFVKVISCIATNVDGLYV